MNYHNITHDDMLNGDGLRVVLWTAGCEHHCKDCQNPITWDAEGGISFTEWEEAEFWEWLRKPWTQGATFSGGDPLHPANRSKIGSMAQIIKEKYPKKDIWVYTGYTLRIVDGEYQFYDQNENFFMLPWLKYIDVLVDGKFECETRMNDILNKATVLWRGSSNQRVINIQESIKAEKIVEKN